MTTRSRTILTVSIRFPVPAGRSQKETLEGLLDLLTRKPSALSRDEIVLKIEKKEIVYL